VKSEKKRKLETEVETPPTFIPDQSLAEGCVEKASQTLLDDWTSTYFEAH